MEHAYRAAPSLHCPLCPAELGPGPLHHCRHCKGTWIEEQSLAERVGSMRTELPRSIEWSSTESRNRPCASCGDAMESVVLFDVTVDRCAPHGVWFERNGLTAVLERSTRVIVPAVAAAAVVAPPASTTSGIDAGDVVLGVVDVAASGIDVVGVVGELGAAALETALDVIGAIFDSV
jgi:Zn-finger nucleic acid-binding protein